MTNEFILVSPEETKETPPPQVSKSSLNKKKATAAMAEKVLPQQKEVPVSKWIMPPEQQGYIQGNDRDCL